MRGMNRTTNAAKRPTEEGGGLTRVILTAEPRKMSSWARGSMPGCCRHRMLPSLDEFHDLGSALFWAGGGG
jgi:hypothetical protein